MKRGLVNGEIDKCCRVFVARGILFQSRRMETRVTCSGHIRLLVRVDVVGPLDAGVGGAVAVAAGDIWWTL